LTQSDLQSDFKKLLTVLAISTGGGFLLGAGIRLGENRQRRSGASKDHERRDRPEAGLSGKSTEDRVSEFLRRLEALERGVDARGSGFPEPPESPHPEIGARMDGAEARLRLDLERRNAESMAALRESLLERIEKRIGPLESEIATQREAVRELSEYSLRTEQSLQKMLEGISRLVDAQMARPHAIEEQPGKGNFNR
jgi:uncharacterized coiled-coil protein SlyX